MYEFINMFTASVSFGVRLKPLFYRNQYWNQYWNQYYRKQFEKENLDTIVQGIFFIIIGFSKIKFTAKYWIFLDSLGLFSIL